MAEHQNIPRYTVPQLGVLLLVVTLGALSLTAWLSFASFVWNAL